LAPTPQSLASPERISRRQDTITPLKQVLIVSPHFPPVNAADMQRVRMSLPFFRDYGWNPTVLAVEPEAHEAQDPLLRMTVPDAVRIERVRPLSRAVSRLVGIGNPALRALRSLRRIGSRLVTEQHIDLIYFSTTMFFSMPLGRIWKRQFDVPYVLDIQDMWHNTYYDRHPEAAPAKFGMVKHAHRWLEQWTMREVGGVVAVSDSYIRTLQQRYPWLSAIPCATIPVGAAATDFELLKRHPQRNVQIDPNDGNVHGAYVGRAGEDMRPALEILFGALEHLRAAAPDPFERVRLHFVGTSYATDTRAKSTVAPVAGSSLAEVVKERTSRVPYFEGLQLLTDADFLVLIGSNDPSYSASKAYPYLMSGKRILAVLNEHSPLVEILQASNVATVVTFNEGNREAAIIRLRTAWPEMMKGLVAPARLDSQVLDRFSAREMTRRQCDLFDRVMTAERRAAA
jgi:hypothetical protein